MIVGGSLITHYQPTDGRRISVTKNTVRWIWCYRTYFTARFSSASGSPGFRVQKWRYSLRRQSSPGAIPEMLSFIQNTGIARILPLRNGRLITCLTDNREPSPCLIWLPAPDITATFPECFSQLILAIRQCIHISLMTERWYPSLEPCRLIYYSGSWYLIALQKGKLRVFPLADIKSVSLTSERFWTEATSTVWSLKSVLSPPCHISLSSINLSTPLTCDRRPAKAVPTGMETICWTEN